MSVGVLGACVVLALAMAALVVLPAFRRAGIRSRTGYNLAVYRDQLAELERDRARGLIGDAEAAAARLEIERRVLKAADPTAPSVGASATPAGRGVVALAAVLVPLLAGALYWRLGAPRLPDQPFAARDTAPGQPDVKAMVARLEARLAADPNDADGWRMLGRSKTVLGDAPAAARAYRKALELQPDAPDALGGLAESLITTQGGVVGAEARDLLGRLDRAKPDDPRAGYYLGLAAAQEGDRDGAVERWRRLLAATPADAPWRPRVVEAVREAAPTFGIDADKLIAEAPQAAPNPVAAEASSPAAAEAARIAALPPEQRAARIKEMVDGLQARLEAVGGDVAGWSRLAQARSMLGERDAALAAWDRALALAPSDPDLLKGKGRTMLGPAQADGDLPQVTDAAALLFERAASLRPADPETQWYLGIRALQQKQTDEARGHWRRALAALDPADPDYAAMQARLAQLPPAEPARP